MTLLYLDTSALVKLYIDEPGSDRVKELALSDAGARLAICSIAQVEFHSAVWRLRRVGELDVNAAKQAAELFDSQFRDKFVRHSLDDWTLNRASELTSRHPLRAYDAVQLASCLALARTMPESPTFVCADRRLLTAAKAEGLPVLDPSEAEEPPVQDTADAEEPPVLDPAESEEPPANPPIPSP